MILEIKPYHVNFTLKRIQIVYKLNTPIEMNIKSSSIHQHPKTSYLPRQTPSGLLLSSFSCWHHLVSPLWIISWTWTIPLSLALDISTLGNSTTTSWKWIWLFTVVYDSFCPMISSFHVIFFFGKNRLAFWNRCNHGH